LRVENAGNFSAEAQNTEKAGKPRRQACGRSLEQQRRAATSSGRRSGGRGGGGCQAVHASVWSEQAHNGRSQRTSTSQGRQAQANPNKQSDICCAATARGYQTKGRDATDDDLGNIKTWAGCGNRKGSEVIIVA
jgi:hypothetical protein